MASLIEIPPHRLAADTLQSLLEEFASRDGTDYGARELSLEEKTARLRRQLERGELGLLSDGDSEQWELAPRERADALLRS